MENRELLKEIRIVVREELKTGLDEVRKEFKSDLKSGLEEVHEMIHDLSTDIDKRFTGLETRLTGVESQMVTKDFLEEKLGEFRGEAVVAARAKRPHRPTA